MCSILHYYCYCDSSFIYIIIIEMKKNFIVLIMATLVFLTVKSQTTPKPKFAPDYMFQMCGKHLASLLSLVCDSKYNTPIPTRIQRHSRSVPNIEELDLSHSTSREPSPEERKKGLLGVILPRKEAQSILGYRRRRKRGVYDECCKKACAYKELQYYCAKEME